MLRSWMNDDVYIYIYIYIYMSYMLFHIRVNYPRKSTNLPKRSVSIHLPRRD